MGLVVFKFKKILEILMTMTYMIVLWGFFPKTI